MIIICDTAAHARFRHPLCDSGESDVALHEACVPGTSNRQRYGAPAGSSTVVDTLTPSKRPARVVSRSKEAASLFDQLYREHASALITMLRKAFGNGPPAPEDLTQQAFEKLMARGDTSDIANVRAFLWRTARNMFLNEQKSQSARSKYDFEVEQLYFPIRGVNLSPDVVLSAQEELKAINQALRNMPERRRRAFLLHRVEGLSVSEVARRLRISRSPADRHITRAAEDIQLCLARLRNSKSD
ncbi:MAG: sigma-70 family RNA polymerase sigma factor [Pseudomonadota bacterium]